MRHFYTPPITEGGRLLPDVRPHAILDVVSPAAAVAAADAAASAEDNSAAPVIKRSLSRRLRATIFRASSKSSESSTSVGDSYSTRAGAAGMLRWDRALYQRHLASLAGRAVVRGDAAAASAAAAAHSPGLRSAHGRAPSVARSGSCGDDWWDHDFGSEAETPRLVASLRASALRRLVPPPLGAGEEVRTARSDWSSASQVEYVAHC